MSLMHYNLCITVWHVQYGTPCTYHKQPISTYKHNTTKMRIIAIKHTNAQTQKWAPQKTEKEIQFVIIQFMLLLSGRDVCC